jgi:hypothetical protein
MGSARRKIEPVPKAEVLERAQLFKLKEAGQIHRTEWRGKMTAFAGERYYPGFYIAVIYFLIDRGRFGPCFTGASGIRVGNPRYNGAIFLGIEQLY